MTYCPIMDIIPSLWKGWYCTSYRCLWRCLYGRILFHYSELQWRCFDFHAFFNNTLSSVWYTWDRLWQIPFWLPLFINACLRCLIYCHLASWLILRIASPPNTSSEVIFGAVACTVDRMENIVDERVPYQGFSLSKSIS